jgi:hypothetical protein
MYVPVMSLQQQQRHLYVFIFALPYGCMAAHLYQHAPVSLLTYVYILSP